MQLYLDKKLALIRVRHPDSQTSSRAPSKNQFHDTLHLTQSLAFCVKPALRPENFGIRTEHAIKEKARKIETNVHSSRDKYVIENISCGRRNTFAKIGDRYKDAQTFSYTCLEVGEFADFFFPRWRGDGAVGNM